MGCGQDHEQSNSKSTQTPREMLHLPACHETKNTAAFAQLQECVVRQGSLHQELLSTKLEFCWSSASPKHCLKAADETERSPKMGWWMEGRKVQGVSHTTVLNIWKGWRGKRAAQWECSGCSWGTRGQMPADTPRCAASSGPGQGREASTLILGHCPGWAGEHLPKKF